MTKYLATVKQRGGGIPLCPGLREDRPPGGELIGPQAAGRDEARAQLGFLLCPFLSSPGVQQGDGTTHVHPPWKSLRKTHLQMCLIKLWVDLNPVNLAFEVNQHKPVPLEWASDGLVSQEKSRGM